MGIDGDPEALRRHARLRCKVEGNIEHLPFRDGAFDLVTANMVVEHVRKVKYLFAEVSRVLAPGGRFLLHTPNAYGYTTALTRLIPSRFRPWLVERLQGRPANEVYPTFYRSNSSPQIHRLAQHGGLLVRELLHVHSSPQLVADGPLAIPELMLIRLLSYRRLRHFRACLIATCEKAPRL